MIQRFNLMIQWFNLMIQWFNLMIQWFTLWFNDSILWFNDSILWFNLMIQWFTLWLNDSILWFNDSLYDSTIHFMIQRFNLMIQWFNLMIQWFNLMIQWFTEEQRLHRLGASSLGSEPSSISSEQRLPRKILQYNCGNLSLLSKDTAITLLYIYFDNNFAIWGTRTIHSKPILIPLFYHTRGGTLKNTYSASFDRFRPNMPAWRHYIY
jgi:hypothetical protein